MLMLQITFLVIGLCIIVLALSFVFKRHARLILWASAIAIFTGTLLLVGIGVINPVDGDATGSITFWSTIMTLNYSIRYQYIYSRKKPRLSHTRSIH